MLATQAFSKFRRLTFKGRLALFSFFNLIGLWLVRADVLAQETGLNELGNTVNLGNKPLVQTIGSIINIGLAVIGVVFFLLIVYGGYLWLTSAGNEEKLARAKKILINATIGVVIVLASFSIASFIVSKLTDATGNGGTGGSGYCPDCVGLGGGFKVASVKPRDTETKVKLCCSVQSIFNYNLSSGSVNQNTVKIYDTKNTSDLGDDALVNGSYNVSDKSFSFKHPDFDKDRQYRVVIAGGKSGIMSLNTQYATLKTDKSWTFTTGSETDKVLPYVDEVYPSIDSTQACLRSAIQVKFSEEMDATSLNRQTILIKNSSGQAVEIDDVTVGSDAMSVTVYTKDNLEKNTKYTVTLLSGDNGITDNCGNPLDGNKNNIKDGTPTDDYSWSFTTGEEIECKPVLETLSPTSGYYFESRLNGTFITLTGKNLGITGEVMFNDTAADAASFDNTNNVICWNNLACGVNKVRVKVPVGYQLGETNNTEVLFKVGREKSNSLDFALLSPYIDQLSPANGAPGQFVTIVGMNFGDTAGQVKFGDKVAELACTAGSWTDTEIVVKVPTGVNLGATYVQVIKNDTDKHPSNGADFTIDNSPIGPGLCSVEPSCAESGGGVISKLTGVNFGSSRGSSFVKVGDTKSTPQGSWSNTEINNAPVADSLNQGRYLVKVNVNNLDSNGKKYNIPCSQLVRPKVVEETTCTENIQSPSPAKSSTEVCRNSIIAARFSEPMNAATLTSANLEIKKCNNTGAFDNSACLNDGAIKNIDILMDGATSNAEGFRATLVNDMDEGYWYRATIKAAATAASSISLAQDYVWYWKVKSGSCTVNKVLVSPTKAYLRAIGETKEYVASALANNCNILNTNNLKWAWVSGDNTKAAVAPVGTSNKATASALDYSPTTPIKITAKLEAENKQAAGDLYISATACQKHQDCRECGTGLSQCVSGNCSPVITKFTPTDGNIGTWITINGCYFGNVKGRVLYKNSAGQDIEGVWPEPAMCGVTWGNNQIISEVPVNTVTNKFTIERASANPGSAVTQQNFEVSNVNYPSLCKVEPAYHNQSQVAAGSAAVKLYGKGFDDKRGSGQVNFIKNGAVTGSVISWSSKNIEAKVPANVALGKSQISVQQNGFYSNRLNYEVKKEGVSQPPLVTSISPSSGLVKSGLATTYISVMGLNFGSSKSDSMVVVRASNTTSHWQTGYDLDGDKGITSKDQNILSLNKGKIVVGATDPNKKFDLNNDSKIDDSDVTTLTNFLKTYPNEHQSGFEAEATTDCLWQDGLVVAKLPFAMSVGETWGVVIKTKAGENTENIPNFTVNNVMHPSICSLSPNSGQAGDKVVIRGDNFGDIRKDSQVSFAQVGGGRVNNSDGEYKSWSNTSLDITVHKDSSTEVGRVISGQVVVTVAFPATYGGTQSSNPVNFSLEPVITSISPEQGPTGTWMTIKGSDFGDCSSRGSTTTSPCVVTFVGPAGRILEATLPAMCGDTWSNNQIITKVPVGAKTGLVKVVTKENVETKDNNSKPFRYNSSLPLAPGLCVLSPNQVSDLPAGVTLKGEGFGDKAEVTDFVQFSNIKFPDRTQTPPKFMYNSWSDNQIAVTAPEETVNGEVYVGLERNLQTGTKCSTTEVNGQCLGTSEPVYSKVAVTSNHLDFTLSSKYKVVSVKPTTGDKNICRNVAITVLFSKSLQGKLPFAADQFRVVNDCAAPLKSSLLSKVGSYWNDVKGWFSKNLNAGRKAVAQTPACEEKSVAGQVVVTGDKKISFIPTSPLAPSTVYRVKLPVDKVECASIANCQWSFTTRQDICLIDKLELTPNKHTFTKVGDEGNQDFYVRALASDAQELSAQYTWSKVDQQNIFNLTKTALEPTKAQVKVISSKNGSAFLYAKADIASFFSDGSNNPVAGKCISGYTFIDRNDNKNIDAGECIKSNYYKESQANLEAYICDFPWQMDIDGYNSTLRYCRGNLSSIKTVPVTNLTNGDFETDFSGWQNSTGSWKISTDTAKQGEKLVYNNNGNGQLSQVVKNLEPNTNYVLKGYVKYSGALAISLGAEQQTFYGNLNNWQNFSILTTSTSSELTINLNAWAGVVYVDGLSLSKSTGILPDLSHPPANPSATDPLRDYLFKAVGSGEAIGLRIYSNNERLSPRDWYNSRNDITRGTPQAIDEIDGYSAIRDGKTVYVGATNKSGTNIYSNIYLLSVSQAGEDDINTIFNALLADWHFNTNLTDTEQAGLQRDLIRLNDLATIKQLLNEYGKANNGEVPKLEAGSFLKGQSVSTWPSWQSALGNDLGRALPVDPINTHYGNQNLKCQAPDFDQKTCWNNKTQVYECPTGSHVYSYKLSNLNSYDLMMNFETKGVMWLGAGSITVGTGDTCNSYTTNNLVEKTISQSVE